MVVWGYLENKTKHQTQKQKNNNETMKTNECETGKISLMSFERNKHKTNKQTTKQTSALRNNDLFEKGVAKTRKI